MRIYYVSKHFFPTTGGSETHALEIAKRTASKNEVIVLSEREGNLKSTEKIGRINIMRIRFLGFNPIAEVITYSIGLMVRLIALCLQRKPHIVHFVFSGAESFVAALPLKLMGIKLIYTSHGTLIGSRRYFLDRINARILDFCEWIPFFAPWDLVIFVDNYFLTRVTSWLRLRRILLLSNGVDPNVFNPYLTSADELRKRCGFGSHQIILLCPRRIDPKNGIIYLIRSIPQIIHSHPSSQLVIVGRNFDKKYYSQLMQEIKDLKIGQHVVFLGDVPHSEMPKYYAISDLVVIPSLAEGTSLAALEAMAMEKTVVATRVGGLPEVVIDGKAGFLVQPANPQELSQTIVRILDDGFKRLKMGGENRLRVLNCHSIDKKTETVEKAYKILFCSPD